MAKKSTVTKITEKQNKPAAKKARKKPSGPRVLRSFIVIDEDGKQCHLKNYCLKHGHKYLTVMTRLRKREGEALILQHDDIVFAASAKGSIRKVTVVLGGKVFQMSPTVAFALEGATFISKKKYSFDGKTWFDIEMTNEVPATEPVVTAAPVVDESEESDEDEDDDDDDEDSDDDDEDIDIED